MSIILQMPRSHSTTLTSKMCRLMLCQLRLQDERGLWTVALEQSEARTMERVCQWKSRLELAQVG